MKILLAMFIVVFAGGLIWFVNPPNNIVETPESTQLPVISRLDILHASDLIGGVKLAVAQNDTDAVDDWLEKAIDLAIIAKLSEEDLEYLQSDRARKYVVFHAKRRLFSDAVEEAYYALYDIESIKAQYPEALNLFADADQLISDRNKLIQQIAAELANGEQVNDRILLEAQQHWKQRFVPVATAGNSSQ
ncbi:MAG: hypothetical protein ACI88A_003508 [Paraglaciecola sp.]|jgi:hypothetical protein